MEVGPKKRKKEANLRENKQDYSSTETFGDLVSVKALVGALSDDIASSLKYS